MTDDQQSQDGFSSENPDEITKLVAAGWIILEGNRYLPTPAGRAALRKGKPGCTFGDYLPVTAVRSRAKPSIKKKGKRRG